MSGQRKDEWENINSNAKKYHLSQYEKPYRSTEFFCDWLDSLSVIDSTSSILDMCCGSGANLYYYETKIL